MSKNSKVKHCYEVSSKLGLNVESLLLDISKLLYVLREPESDSGSAASKHSGF